MGDIDDPPVLLIMGLGAQLLLWRTAFCEKLVGQGLRVIRYDNRDVGLSSKTEPHELRTAAGDRGCSAPGSACAARPRTRWRTWPTTPRPCSITSASSSAHIVGASMGGMIAQVFAARFAERTKIAGGHLLQQQFTRSCRRRPRARCWRCSRAPPPDSPREVIVDNAVRVSRIIGSPRYRMPEEQVRAEAAEGYDRNYYPRGVARQFSAILGSGSLPHYDRRIVAPTVVIHGRADKLMRPFGGRAVARAINGARLVLFDGMGHDLPQQLWDRVIGVLTSNFAEAG